jgi:hypothetical protein
MPATRVIQVRAAVLWVVVAAAIGLIPAQALAAPGIPAEQTGRILEVAAITAIVGDVDGDGGRELVTLGPREDDPVHLAVTVFDQRVGGRAASAGSAPLARVASVTEQLSGLPRPNEDNLLQARVDEPARLLAWRERGREHVLAVAIGTLRNARACCLTIWIVERTRDGIGLRLLTDTMESADQVRVVDLDADGTDELVFTEPPEDSRPGSVRVGVLRWTGRRFGHQSVTVRAPLASPLLSLGNSDGRPGDELGLITGPKGTGDDRTARLTRISVGPRGEVRTEVAQLPFFAAAFPLAGADGGRLVIGDNRGRMVVLRWPAGGRLATVVASAPGGLPVATLGEGAQAVVVTVRDIRLLELVGPDGEPISGRIEGSAAEPRFRSAGIRTYFGPLPGGTASGEPAFIFRGRLITYDRTQAEVVVSDASVLPNAVPVGFFGERSGLFALARGRLGTDFDFDATREGGQLAEPAGASRLTSIAVADAATALAPEADEGLIEPTFEGLVRAEDDGRRGLAGGGFSVVVEGPPGTQVQLAMANTQTGDTIGQAGFTRLFVPSDGVQEGVPVRLTVLAVSPGGQGYGATWSVTFQTGPPALSVSGPFAPLSFDVRVSGSTAPGTTVTVDGAAVPVAADGQFDQAVSAGIWPRDVRIEATDPLGNRSTATVSVVALLDYRQLPWIPIVALLTILAGIGLYLRVPHARPATASASVTDATLEDLD